MRRFNVAALMEQFKPVFCLTCFFKSNVHFMVKIGFALSSFCLFDICTDTGPAS